MERCERRLRYLVVRKSWIAALLAMLVVAPVAGQAFVTAFPKVSPYLPVPRGAAVILNTGSTNATGYRIVVAPDGQSEYVASSDHNSAAIPKDLATRFFADLKRAMPLSSLPSAPCMKSASFGTSLFVWWRGQRSQDLTCVFDARGRALVADASAIAQALHIPARPSRPVMRPLMPGETHRAVPSPRLEFGGTRKMKGVDFGRRQDVAFRSDERGSKLGSP